MRFLFIYVLLTQLAFAQLDTGMGTIPLCTENTFLTVASANNIYDCVDVEISNSLSNINDPSLPLTIKATGRVLISAPILFQGQDATNGNGGNGGPGGGNGGFFLASGNPGNPFDQGGYSPSQAPICNIGSSIEGSGGAGGNLVDQGQPGKPGQIISGPGTPLAGGIPGSTTVAIDLNNFIFAGGGGGSGELGCNQNSPEDGGGGGGGGGSIRIIAAEDITINSTINVSGGVGGTSLGLGGGGGGGSAGFIVLQSLSKVIINGSLIPTRGRGGKSFSTSVDEGDGGAGAPGLIMIEDIDGVNFYTNIVQPTPTTSRSLNSDISCGTLAKLNEEHHQVLQIAAGFLFAMMFGLMIKILSRFPVRS